jgi:hypothetical protein
MDLTMEKPATPATESTRRGRESGTLVTGSLPWSLSRLAVDEVLLVPDAPNRAQQLGVAIARVSSVRGGEYAIQVCAGVPLTFDGTAFRFYQVTRTA